MSSVSSQCDTCRPSARWRGIEIIEFHALIAMLKDYIKLLEGHLSLIQEKKGNLVSAPDACNTKQNPLQTLLHQYSGVCIHVVKRLNDEDLRFKERGMVAKNLAKAEVRVFLRNLIYFMKNSMGQHIANTRAFVG